MLNQPTIDYDYIQDRLYRLLKIPSPTGMTDAVVCFICEELRLLGISYELTRRGAIRGFLPGREEGSIRGIAAHLDTLGVMVKELKENGRLRLVSVGTWSSRSAEGARVTVFLEDGQKSRGTILPLMASGHVYGDAMDTQPGGWDNVELRLDEPVETLSDLISFGFRVGDRVSVDPSPEFLENGFINARHLDDKAGVVSVLAAAKAVLEMEKEPPLRTYLLFTISEEVGVGASHILHGGISELISVDNGTIAPGQNTIPYGVTVAMMDSSGPFDRHLTDKLLNLCRENNIQHARDIFRYYRSDAAAALEAGNDIRTALVCFGLDASHGHERTHMDSLLSVSRLLSHYLLEK